MLTFDAHLDLSLNALGGFNRDDYVTEFRFAPARDGAQVPVTLLYRKGLKRDGKIGRAHV